MNIAQLKQTVRVEDVVGQRIKLRRRGPLFIGYCPFHHDTGRPNLVVFPKTQTWACFACSAQGDMLALTLKTPQGVGEEVGLLMGEDPVPVLDEEYIVLQRSDGSRAFVRPQDVLEHAKAD